MNKLNVENLHSFSCFFAFLVKWANRESDDGKKRMKCLCEAFRFGSSDIPGSQTSVKPKRNLSPLNSMAKWHVLRDLARESEIFLWLKFVALLFAFSRFPFYFFRRGKRKLPFNENHTTSFHSPHHLHLLFLSFLFFSSVFLLQYTWMC